ncbi:hypothetical protein [Mesorhizobium sp. B1-1-7]|uniref:hypothetical protein n=1 Tax=Mesorhizobium sp. B1-1-7 TaxID=2589977 RepID=UPI0011262FAC|nr:hypothetical protein [Mesorhizobium sp. B1-1-7]TPN53979.1 hypothetical protein FJ978_07705 [Mesorhizobium sp. B1-1-7]
MPNTHVPAAGEAVPSKCTIFLAMTPTLRLQLATTIESLIALLDEIDGDSDVEATGDDEPSLGWNAAGQPGFTEDVEFDTGDDEDGHDREPTLGASNDYNGSRNQTWSYQGSSQQDECEVENEHGGDILDEPHDEEDRESFLGWTEKCGQTGVGLDGWTEADDEGPEDHLWLGSGFTGAGYVEGREMVRKIGAYAGEPEPVRVLCLPARR